MQSIGERLPVTQHHLIDTVGKVFGCEIDHLMSGAEMPGGLLRPRVFVERAVVAAVVERKGLDVNIHELRQRARQQRRVDTPRKKHPGPCTWLVTSLQ